MISGLGFGPVEAVQFRDVVAGAEDLVTAEQDDRGDVVAARDLPAASASSR